VPVPEYATLLRINSVKAAVAHGYPTNPRLPLLESSGRLKAERIIVDRLVALCAVTASAFTFDRAKARTWLHKERVWHSLTNHERLFLENGTGDTEDFEVLVEAMWALAWALGKVDDLDFGKACSDNFVDILPDLRIDERSDALRSGIKLRPVREVEEACDLAYCLHWGISELLFRGKKLPGRVHNYVIIQRRHALEWLISDEPWDEVHMDT
jgi:Domain of unknown function (DUF4272)